MNWLLITLGILLPFIGTSFGSFLVFLLKNKLQTNAKIIFVGLAIGVMIAASIWSLIIPSIEMSFFPDIISWIPAVVGLILGGLFLVCLNDFIERKNINNGSNMLMFSVTLHNIPEGMAVGVCLAGALSLNSGISLVSALILSLGIAIQNIPEGAIISMPLYSNGNSKKRAFFTGVLSGVVEPIATVVTIILVKFVVPILPFLLSFAAGAMIYVVIEELVDELHNERKSWLGIMSVILGFSIMMILDVTLG